MESIEKNLIKAQDPDATDSPEGSEWYISCNCGPTQCLRIKNDKKRRVFWGYLEFGPCMPIFVVILTLLPLGFFVDFVLTGIGIKDQLICSITIMISLVMFLWSYFGAACKDPGFLPFDWVKTQRFYYKWEEQLSGLAINERQIEFAMNENNRPKFASFSKSAGRYVIRADHICGWVNNWVGKRNHKQFILMCLWGSIYSFVLIIWDVIFVKNISEKGSIVMLIMLVCFSIELSFGILLLYVFFENLKDLKNNVTTIQKWKELRGQSYGCQQSMREVCGNHCYLCWLIPISAFDKNMIIEADDIPPEAPEPTI